MEKSKLIRIFESYAKFPLDKIRPDFNICQLLVISVHCMAIASHSSFFREKFSDLSCVVSYPIRHFSNHLTQKRFFTLKDIF